MDGCTACWGDEATPRVFWQDTRADASRRVNETRADWSPVETCAACGRTYAVRYTIVHWLTDDAVCGTPPGARPQRWKRVCQITSGALVK